MNRPSDPEERDQSLERALDAVRAGSDSGWPEIYESLAPAVLGFMRVRRAPSPEDQTGEVFVQVVRDFDRFEGDARDFRAWVMTIAHHRLLDARRTLARKPPPAPLDPDVHLSGGDVAEEGIARLTDATVLQLFEQLSEDQKLVLTLRIVADLTVEQVAQAVGKRPGAVKALQRRGLARLEQLIGRGPSGDPQMQGEDGEP